MEATKIQSEEGFSLLELVAVLVILSVIVTSVVPKFVDLTDEAEFASIDATAAALQAGQSQIMAAYFAQGSPGMEVAGNVTVTINDIPIRFNNGQIRTTINSNHVPTVPQNQNAAYTRLFFLFLDGSPGEIIRRNSEDSGWAMLGSNASCAAGTNPRRCWEYRSNNSRVTRITYHTTTGLFERD